AGHGGGRARRVPHAAVPDRGGGPPRPWPPHHRRQSDQALRPPHRDPPLTAPGPAPPGDPSGTRIHRCRHRGPGQGPGHLAMASQRFPRDFVWGTATSAHQVEGGNWNNDWWMWEHMSESPCQEPSGDACDHWHRYADDIRLCADLGFGAYRFSLEWSRIEPEEGEYSTAALEHYRRIWGAWRQHGLE